MTYKQVQVYVKKKYGYIPQTCWIAHVKEMCGLPVRKAHNRTGKRKKPCPDNKVNDIKYAFKHFGMI